MADEANPKPVQPENSSEKPMMPQIGITPKPEPLKVNLATPAETKEPAVASLTTSPVPTATAKIADPKEAKPDKNVFTQLFGDDKVMQSSNMMETVNKHEDKDKKSVFSKKPSLKSLKDKKSDKAKGPGQSGKIMLRVSLLILVLTGAFFFTQNNVEFTLFGTNPAQKVELASTKMTNIQAEIHVQQHLSAVLLLDQFAGVSDSYLYNLAQADSYVNSSNKQEEYAESADEDAIDVINALAAIQGKVAVNISTDEKIAATALIGELITSLEAIEGEVDAGTLSQDIEDLETTRSLIQNNEYRSSLAGANLEEIDEEGVEDLLASYTDLNKSKQAVISGIRTDRVEWSNYFNEVETLTKKVDPLFNTEFPGNLVINDVRFSQNEISISGETTTDDTKNFTLVSNYIDTLESSSSFINVEDRSYSKSAGTDSVTGNFRISLEFEE
jgi:hypothetical protein